MLSRDGGGGACRRPTAAPRLVMVTTLASGGNRPENYIAIKLILLIMKANGKVKGNNTRAYPRSDANATSAKHARAFPQSDGMDKNNHSHQNIRLATWNVGSLTGRSQELAETLKRRNINICCVQETRWKGSKSRDLGLGYQLVYYGKDTRQNGVGIVLDSHFRNRIVNIERRSDRIIAIKLAMDNQPVLNIACTYAPQVGCSDLEKADFWEDLDELMVNIPDTETKILMGDLNGHIGNANSTYIDFHGGYGYGTLNKEGEQILDFASRHNLSIVNTLFKKKDSHLITYNSGGRSSQIDFVLTDRKIKSSFRDCKVIPGEPLTSQHRLLVAVFRLPKPIKTLTDKTPRIKWKELTGPKGECLIVSMRKYLTQDLEILHQNADMMWTKLEAHCRGEASKILGISRGGISTGKDPTWWDKEVQEAVNNKKDLFKTWQSSQLEHDRELYKEAKRKAKRCVAQSRAQSRESFYIKLDNAHSDADIFRLAKNRHESSLDFKVNKFIKSKNNTLLTTHEDINNRWHEYYKELLNEEFSSQSFCPSAPAQGPIHEVTLCEVKQALRKMKNHKALGPDEIPADLWKALGPIAIVWLTRLFNTIMRSLQIPKSWRQSFLVPFYKNKGDITLCSNYRGIKLTSHTLKLWERILNRRFLDICQITPNQFGFTPSKSTTDAIQAVRILIEKHRVNNVDLHFAFIDLEKAFDRVPRRLVWQAMREQLIPEDYVLLVQDMYRNICTKVRSPAGLSREFAVEVGVHQGSALSPWLFNIVMDFVTKKIQHGLPWNLLYADDVALVAESAEKLQVSLNEWITALEGSGLRVSRSKTEHLECKFSNTAADANIYYSDGTQVPKVDQFRYLGSVVTRDANSEADVSHRINVAWQKWRTLTGVLCDPRMPIRIKGKVYKAAVRPAMLYGAECWTVKETHVQKLHVAEMKMLRWSGGVTRLDKIRNEYVQGSFKVTPISEKLTEKRLRWYGHVMRRDSEHVVHKALSIPEGKKKRGRPPLTWWTSMANLIKKTQLPDPTTQDRLSWRRKIRRADPT